MMRETKSPLQASTGVHSSAEPPVRRLCHWWRKPQGRGNYRSYPGPQPPGRRDTSGQRGTAKSLNIDARTTLLDALREHIGLTGSKKGCDHGQCGACTVMVGGRRVLSCLTLALTAQDQQITTIEGLSQGGKLHPMQQAFIDQDAFQCGYCTPGQIVSAIACVKEGHATSDDDIREYMSGNICRCAAYPNIVAAVKQAAPAMADEQKG